MNLKQLKIGFGIISLLIVCNFFVATSANDYAWDASYHFDNYLEDYENNIEDYDAYVESIDSYNLFVNFSNGIYWLMVLVIAGVGFYIFKAKEIK